METISYRGDGVDMEVTVRRPTISDELRTASILKKVQEAVREGLIDLEFASATPSFIACVSNAIDPKGLTFELPRVSTSAEGVAAVFKAWLELPAEFGNAWYEKSLEVRAVDDPKANRSERKARSRSAKQRTK